VSALANRTAVLSALFAVSLVMLQAGVIRFAGSSLAVRIVLPATIAAVPVALWPHRRHIGIWVMYVGLAANLAAILANGGLMPIERSTVISAVGRERALTYQTGDWIAGSKDVLLASGGGHATALGDSIVIHMGHAGIAASPGDLVVWAGIVILAGELSWGWQRRRSAARQPAGTPPAPALADGAEGGAATLS
jgi:hypothetical protein